MGYTMTHEGHDRKSKNISAVVQSALAEQNLWKGIQLMSNDHDNQKDRTE